MRNANRIAPIAAAALFAAFCIAAPVWAGEKKTEEKAKKEAPAKSLAVEIEKLDDYHKLVSKAMDAGKTAYLYFYSQYIDISKDSLPIFEKLASENPKKVALFTLNVDAFDTLVESYALEYVPTVIMVKPGQGVSRFYVVDIDEKDVRKDFESLDLKSDDFKQMAKLASAGKASIVMFYADWCGNCQRLAPVMEAFKTKYQNKVQVASINVEKAREVSSMFWVNGIPDVMVFDENGLVIDRYVGLPPFNAEALLKQSLKSIGLDLDPEGTKKEAKEI